MFVQLREWFTNMPRGKKIQLAVLSIFVIVLAVVVVGLITRTTWVRVPVADPAASPHVYSALVDMGFPTRIESGNILVPEERLGEAQMRLREQGILGATDFTFDIMEGAAGFGVTDAHARQLYDAQTAEHIRTQLLQVPRIQNALIIVNSGETSPFRIHTNARQATATVMLTLSDGGRLTQQEVQAIGELIRNAVPGISYENISISDSDLNFYPVGDASQDIDMIVGQRSALENRLTEQMQGQVMQLLAPIFGAGNLQVQPHVSLNFDAVVTESVEFTPPIYGEMDGIVRSSEEIFENSRRLMDAEGVPDTDSNYMGTEEYPFGTLEDTDEYRRAVISRNFEINETRQRIEHERGTIQELSIAVLINSEIEGVRQDFSEEVTDLVARAIGVDPVNIAVQLLPFAYDEDTTIADLYEQWAEMETARADREHFETIIMYATIVLLGIMAMILVITIVKAAKKPVVSESAIAVATATGTIVPEGIDIIVGDDEPQLVEYEDANLSTKTPGLEQIERFIDKDSASVVQLRPFDFIRKIDSDQILNVIHNEHPQIIALILSYIEPKQSASIIASLPPEKQTEIISRISSMGSTSPEYVKEAERILKRKITSMGVTDNIVVGGIDAAVGIINALDSSSEKSILESLDISDGELADEIRKRLFIFEDIAKLNNATVQRVLREINNADLAVALKMAGEDVTKTIFNNISKRLEDMIKDDMEAMGPVRVRDVEEAQQRIVNAIRKLEDEGKIIIARGEGDDFIV